MRKINSTLHGLCDYAITAGFFLAPTLFRLSPIPALVAHSYAAIFSVTNLLTRYPLSAAKLIPFPLHGATEGASGVALLGLGVSPLPMSVGARLFYLSSGLQLVTLVAFSDYTDTSLEVQPLLDPPVHTGVRQPFAEMAEVTAA